MVCNFIQPYIFDTHSYWHCLSPPGLPYESATAWVTYTAELLSQRFGGWKSEVQVPAGLVSSAASLPGLSTAAVPVSPRGRPSLRVRVLISSSCQGMGHTGVRPTLMISFQLNFLFKGSISKYCHTLRYGVLQLERMNFMEHNSNHSIHRVAVCSFSLLCIIHCVNRHKYFFLFYY